MLTIGNSFPSPIKRQNIVMTTKFIKLEPNVQLSPLLHKNTYTRPTVTITSQKHVHTSNCHHHFTKTRTHVQLSPLLHKNTYTRPTVTITSQKHVHTSNCHHYFIKTRTHVQLSPLLHKNTYTRPTVTITSQKHVHTPPHQELISLASYQTYQSSLK